MQINLVFQKREKGGARFVLLNIVVPDHKKISEVSGVKGAEAKEDQFIAKEPMHNIQLPTDEANYVKINKILTVIIPKHLRKYFIKQWNITYQKWQSDSNSGEFLVKGIADTTTRNAINEEMLEHLKSGNEQQWDIVTLGFVLLSSDLELIENHEKTQFNAREEVQHLVRIAKSFSAQKSIITYPSAEYTVIVEKVKRIAGNVFDKDAVQEIDDIDNSPMERKMKLKLKQLQEKEKSRKKENNQSSEKWEDYQPILELSTQEGNFIVITELLRNVVPKHLGRYFVKQWDNVYPDQKWQSNTSSGQQLLCKLEIVPENNKSKEMINALKTGNEETWSIDALMFVLNCTSLSLISPCRHKSQRKEPFRPSKEISFLRSIAGKFFSAHKASISCPSEEFRRTVAMIQKIARNLFDTDAETEICEMVKDQMERNASEYQSTERAKETEEDSGSIATNDKPGDNTAAITPYKGKVEDGSAGAVSCIQPARGEVRNVNVSSGGIVVLGDNTTINLPPPESHRHDVTERNIEEVICNLREMYEECCKMHKIHKIKGKWMIELEDEEVENFAVKLTISHELAPEDTLQDERKLFFDHLIGAKGDKIDLEDLIDSNSRVTFVRGIAGMGKTVLAKQLAWKWSVGEIYKNFPLLVMFECRELNDFHRRNETKINKHELLDKFIERKFKHTLRDVKELLFLVDGLDELYDINSDDEESIIWQLLDLNTCIYRKSKVIITGRPHVENKLSKPGKCLGGVRKVEIQGLNDEEIAKFVEKVAQRKEDRCQINNAIANSKRSLPILHVPQFLNTFCCAVNILEEGKTICSTVELYCWTVYLLMKQHAGNKSSDETLSSKLFDGYSKELMFLAEVCHDLLKRNKIIFEGDFDSITFGSKSGKEFIASLFVNVSGRSSRYQFKHLSLMEFLSAFYICTHEQCKENIQGILERGYIDIVVYACELITAFSCEGIVRDMLFYVGKLTKLDENLAEILAVVGECHKLDDKTKFQRSLDILMCFTTTDNADKMCILQCLKRLHCDPMFKLGLADTYKMHKIINHLTETYRCSKEELQSALNDVHIGEFVANDWETVECLKYLGIVDMITFNDIKNFRVNAARAKVNAWNKTDDTKCTLIWIEDCKFDEEEEKSIEETMLNSHLDELVIWKSILTKNSFINLCNWLISCKKVVLDQLLIENELFLELVEAIEKKKQDLVMNELIITRCTSVNNEMRWRILQCGVRLTIDGHEVVLPPPFFGARRSPLDSHPKNTEEKEKGIAHQQETNNVQIVINKSGGTKNILNMKLSFEVPPNAVENEVILEIGTIDAKDSPPIPFQFGEMMLSDVIQVKPIGEDVIKFKEPVILSVNHGIDEIPQLSTIVMKCYDYKNKEWKGIPLITDEAMGWYGITAGKISETALFVVCTTLDAATYWVPKEASKFALFDSKYNVNVAFEDNTFEDGYTRVEVKMNIFSKEAIDDLSYFGVKPFPVLHMKETNKKQPKKPVSVTFTMTGRERSNGKLMILRKEKDAVKDIISTISHDVKDNILTVRCNHLSDNPIIIINVDLTTSFDVRSMWNILHWRTGPAVWVNLRVCAREDMAKGSQYLIASFDASQENCFRQFIKDNGYVLENPVQMKMFNHTELRVELEGRYLINNDTAELKLEYDRSSYTHTPEFSVRENPEFHENSYLVICKKDGTQVMRSLFSPKYGAINPGVQ